MWPNLQFPADLKFLMENFIFCAVKLATDKNQTFYIKEKKLQNYRCQYKMTNVKPYGK